MALLQILASTTRKRAIDSAVLPRPLILPPLFNKSRLLGKVTIVSETGDPRTPVAAIEDLIGGSIVLTKAGVALVTGTGLTYAANAMSFTFNIVNDVIDALLAASVGGFITAVLEVRFQTATQSDTVIREELAVFAVDTDVAPVENITFVDTNSIHWSLVP